MLTVSSLKGGHLADVVKERMLEDDKVRAKFSKHAAKPDRTLAGAWEAFFGWRPADELIEWTGVARGYGAVFDDVSDVWMLTRGIEWIRKAPRVEKLLGDLEASITLLTGLELFGHDPSGDRCFVSTLPSRTRTAEVHVYNHENGELDGALYYSIGDLIFSCYHPGEDEEPPSDKKLLAAFNKDMEKARKGLPKLEEPRALFNRVKWMWELPAGEPGYHFAEDMARAPTFADFEKEKALFPKAPWLANYWLLAHYFLGNAQACAETVQLAAKAPGAATPALARLVGALLDAPKKAKLGALEPAQLAELRAAVQKNADPSLLEPGAREAVERQRAGSVVKADRKAVLARLAAKEDGWKLMAEFPDDVETHDAILDVLAKKDAALAETVERYREARVARNIFDDWPDKWSKEKIDRRLSRPVAAAFRSGLGFDADNKRAYAPLVHTLAHFDDDFAMDGFAAAIEKLRMDDARHEYVVAALRASKHERARELLDRAAWRFFDFFEQTIAAQKKKAAEGPTLDNMFRVDSHLLPAVIAGIARGDQASEKLVDKVLSITSNMSVLETAYAAAYRQVGEKKLARHAAIAESYCRTIDAFKGEALPAYGHYNFAEAALALAKLAPDRAKKLLKEMIGRERGPQLRLEVAGGALAGLLYLFPKDPEVLAWADRVLANRGGEDRIYGALRGVAEGKVRAAKELVRPHLYIKKGLDDDTTLGRTARAALVALGEPNPPEFDDRDEFASSVGKGRLLAALEQPHRYRTSYVFERMLETKAKGQPFIDACVRTMREHLRFSADPPSSHEEVVKNATKVLLAQGAPALAPFASLLDVEQIDPSQRTTILYCMGIVTDMPALLDRLASLDEAKLLALLERPTPDVMGALDVVAGIASARAAEKAQRPIEAALEWRLGLFGGETDVWAENEPTGTRLAALAARSPRGKKLVQQRARAGKNYHVKELLKRGLELAPPIAGFEGSERVLEMAMRGEDYDGPRYRCTVRHDGKRLSLSWAGENIYFEGMLENQKYEQAGTFAAPAASADVICRALTAIGFAPPAPAKKKRRG